MVSVPSIIRIQLIDFRGHRVEFAALALRRHDVGIGLSITKGSLEIRIAESLVESGSLRRGDTDHVRPSGDIELGMLDF